MRIKNSFAMEVANSVLALLDERRARLYTDRKAFYVWPRDGRVMVIFDPNAIDTRKVNDEFAHSLSTRSQGRLVVRTNTRGIFLQVKYEKPLAPVELVAQPLDLSRQPSPFHIPVGFAASGDIWLSLLEGDSFFVVGMRGKGKSAELHGFIQALLNGGQTLIHAWDGKNNAEYLRYFDHENFTLMPMNGLQSGLEAIQSECDRRMLVLARSGHPNIISYNAQAKPEDAIKPIALIVDEVAEVEDQTLLLKQVKVNRAAGVFPIFATNEPSKSAVIAKSNLGTRISFYVPSASDSITGFGRPGANRLPTTRGRGLIMLDGRATDFQSYIVTYGQPTEAGLAWLAAQTEASQAARVAESVEEANAQEKTDAEIALEEKISSTWLALRETKEWRGWNWIERAVYGEVKNGARSKKIKRVVAGLQGVEVENDDKLNAAINAEIDRLVATWGTTHYATTATTGAKSPDSAGLAPVFAA